MTSGSTIKAAKRRKAAEVSPSFRTFLALDRPTLLASLLLFAAVLAFYSSVTRNGFIDYDDPDYIVDNPQVKAGLTWSTVKWAFVTDSAANWHPLTWLSHALDCDLFGLNPAGPHWVNVVLHGLSAVLLFWLLQTATGFRWRSLMVASLFALHPINVESVAWAAERKNVLSMVFFLLALYAYVWYARQPSRGRYAAVAGLFTLALMAKPQVITFPFLLMLFDYWPLGRIRLATNPAYRADTLPQSTTPATIGSLLREKIPLLLLAAASAVVTMKAQFSGNAVKDLSRYSFPLRLETAVVSYVRYLGKAFWPSKLVALYPHPVHLYPAGEMGAAVFLLLLITSVVCVRLRQQPYLAMGWFWFLGSLVPMIGLVQVGEQAMADRYAYIAFIGLFVITVWLLADLASAVRISARWLAVPAVSCVLVLGVLTYRQVTYWHDTESFWRRATVLTSGNYIAERDLASVLHTQHRNAEATQHLRAALAIRPDDLLSNMYYGGEERSRGNLASAIEHFQLVADHATRPRLIAQANTELGSVYMQLGQPQKAKQYLETSLRFVPNQPTLMVSLGLIAQKSGDLPEAVRQYQRASELRPYDVYDLLLAQALQLEGHADEAKAISQRVAQTSPNLAQAQRTMESLLVPVVTR
jgi:tetratricopeptide (TPR) repeat protein